MSSPLAAPAPPSSPPRASSTKVKRPPPITPNRFTRFFTPRNSKSSRGGSSQSKAHRQLRDITRSVQHKDNVSRKTHTTPRKAVTFVDIAADCPVENVETPVMSSRKRRKLYLSPESSPVQSSPSKRARDARYPTPPLRPILEKEPETPQQEPRHYPTPIRRLRSTGGPSRILQRSFGGSLAIGRGFVRDSGSIAQNYTSDFYSSQNDVHQLPRGAPPFCTASCNTNNIVAVGDEDGYITLLDADEDSTFTKAHLAWRGHHNAIMDIQFSSDDMYIATGSGDQTSQIIDVRTQQTVQVLAKHKSSVKQVRFQPGDDKIVATSSRDGAVQIWDLRCRGGVNNVHSAWGPEAPYGSVVRTLLHAHADGGERDPSVTALSFLPEGRQHLLLTASDASTCVKLWDIRSRYRFHGPALPISTTSHPESHNRHRHFAINSLTLSGDAARLYALSKDNTIYAYSVNHLVLGSAPELSENTSSQTKSYGLCKQGLGPMYGFRHRNFHAASFYVKAALRKAQGNQPELLAVGSSDGCPVLFPTDENLLKREPRREDDEDDDDLPCFSTVSSRASLSTRTSGRGRFPSLMADTIPIYEHGTPLVRGHETEVTSVAWARNGSLVSVGDDCRVRNWREGPLARQLRGAGETEGARWACGWAHVEDGFDDDDE